MLCATCVRIFQDSYKEGTHHSSYDNLERAADLGCKICIYLRRLLREGEGPDEDTEMFHPFTTYCFQPWTCYRMGPRFELKLYFPASWLDQHLKPLVGDVTLHVSQPVSPPRWWPEFLESINQDLKTMPWNVREDKFGTRPIPKSTGDPKVLELGLEWLDTCRNNHVKCEAVDETRQPGYYPSRLLDVGTLESNILRLVMTEVEPPAEGHRYATLSHCWGHASFVQLNAENIDSFNAKIPPECLPQSFTDAVMTCRSLRIRYLWIDSLCILQSGTGSIEDWQLHVGTMDAIYANCVLNLSIARASNPEQGAFVTRNPAFIKTTMIYSPVGMDLHNPGAYLSMFERTRAEHWGFLPNMVYAGPEDISRPQAQSCLVSIFVPGHNRYTFPYIYGKPASNHDSAGCDFASSLFHQPLYQRGWVFQERLMSPRMLSFGNDRIYWQCHEKVLNEYLPYGLPGSEEMYDMHAKPPFTLAYTVLRAKPPPILTEKELASLNNSWYQLVEYYSETDLTYPEKDKLAAVAAIAKHYGRISTGTYCAGIFVEPDISLGLLWRHDTIAVNAHSKSIGLLSVTLDGERSSDYRAPTWSWASVDGKVEFGLLVSVHLKPARELWHRLLRVEDVSIELEEPSNPYGQVRSAEISISGSLLQDIVLNTAGVEQNLTGLFVLEVKDTRQRLHGIILSHTESDTYQRKGYFSSMRPADGSRFPTEKFEKRTIKMI
jgi:hypothetical protein